MLLRCWVGSSIDSQARGAEDPAVRTGKCSVMIRIFTCGIISWALSLPAHPALHNATEQYGTVCPNFTCTLLECSPGTAGREINSSCTACTTQSTGYSFSWNLANDWFASPALAKSLAADNTECIAQYSQLIDGAWYLPLKSQKNVRGLHLYYVILIL